MPSPEGVDLGKVLIGTPVASVHQREKSSAVGAWLGPEDARGRAAFVGAPAPLLAGVLFDEVHVIGLLEFGDGGESFIQEGDQIRKGIPEEAADPDGNVDPWTS